MGSFNCLRQDSTPEQVWKKNFRQLFFYYSKFVKAFFSNNVFWGLALLRNLFNCCRRVGKATAFPPQKEAAFTLAEVLITLGIIGVVAAMTLPTLVQNYNKKITEVRLKKFYSVMNQAVDRLKVEYGDTKNWDYTVDNVYDGEGTGMDNLTDQSGQIMSNFKRYFGKVIKFTDEENVNVEGHNMTLFYFADGSAIMPLWYNNFDYEFFPKNAKKCLTYPHNERYGTCSFPFQFYTNSRNTFIPYYNGSDNMTMESLYENASKGCRNGNHISGNYCGLIIMKNNWTVPDDYPRKLAY